MRLPTENGFQQNRAASNIPEVDALNAEFYHKYQYPWRPSFWERLSHPDLFRRMICQELGDWDGKILPASRPLRIWVAGCGTNQAVITALQFPNAEILGTDLAANSLQTATESVRWLEIQNTRLVRTSINDSEFESEFDYIICTGVIHHNAKPDETLKKIQRALKPGGIAELMVYNQYHSVFVTGFQKAFQLLRVSGLLSGVEEIVTARSLLQEMKVSKIPAGPMSASVATTGDAQLADLLLQPIWHSYDLATFTDLCGNVGMQLLAPCHNQFDRANRAQSWDWNSISTPIKDIVDALPEEKRWELINHLFQENSPMIWFYTARTDCPWPKKTQQKITEEFLKMRGKRIDCKRELWGYRTDEGIERKRVLDFPPPPQDVSVKKFLATFQDNERIDAVVDRSGILKDFNSLNALRLLLTSRSHPYLEIY
jgi:hypothetical protein